MIGRYDLDNFHPCYDFFNWLVMAKAAGVTEVRFGVDRVRTDKWPEHVMRRRYESYIRPGPALAGLPASEGDGGADCAPQQMRDLVLFCRAGRHFERLQSPIKSVTRARYTVTLRQSPNLPHRNCNVAAWRQFAAEIGARVIEDHDVDPVSLLERVSLYAGAAMNFGVLNGPTHLCSLTPYPVMIFKANHQRPHMERSGLPWGSQPPWHGPNQFLVYADDDLDSLRAGFDRWRTSGAP